MLWWIVAPDTISAHDVSVKILRRFRAEHSCPHHKIFKKSRAVCRLAFGFSGPPCFRCFLGKRREVLIFTKPRRGAKVNMQGGVTAMCRKSLSKGSKACWSVRPARNRSFQNQGWDGWDGAKVKKSDTFDVPNFP